MDGLLAAKIYPPRPTGTPPGRGFSWKPFLAGVLVVISVPFKRHVKNSSIGVIGNLKDVGKLRTRSKRNTPTQTKNT